MTRQFRSFSRVHLLGALVAAFASCGPTPTPLVIVLRGDIDVLAGARVDAVIHGEGGTRTLPSVTLHVGSLIDRPSLPLEIPLTPTGGDWERTFVLDVLVTPVSGPPRTLRLRGGFVEDRTLRTDVWITPPPVCDGAITADCIVHIRGPAPGAFTGSVHAPSDGDSASPLRPRFQWDTVTGARYELELDGSCGGVSPDLCPFVGAMHIETAETDHIIESPLDVSLTAPVGRRYVWRVRACTTECSAWSEPRTLEVGRQRTDVNGDGHADLVIGAPNSAIGGHHGDGALYFLAGGPDLSTLGTPERLRTGCLLGQQVSAIGDVDGDEFPDVAIAAPQTRDGTGTCEPAQPHLGGLLHVFFGSGSGLVPGPDIPAPAPTTLQFGVGTTAGDLDRDGLSDLIVPSRSSLTVVLGREDRVLVPLADAEEENESFLPAASCCADLDSDGRGDLLASRNGGVALVSEGELRVIDTPTGVTLPAEDRFSVDVALPDLDGDGDSELVVGSCPFTHIPVSGEVWRALAIDAPFVPLDHAMFAGTATTGFYGCQAANLGDLDGDGRDDVGANAAFVDAPSGSRGILWLAGGSHRIELVTDVNGGDTIGVGDIDGDGLDDLVVAESRAEITGCACRGGRLKIFLGRPGFDLDPTATPDLMVTNPEGTSDSDFGGSMAEAYP